MPALQTTAFILDGNRYTTTVLGAIEARKLYLRLIKALAPMLEKLDPAKLKTGDEKAVFELAAAAVSEFPENLYEDLCEAFARNTTLDTNNTSMPLDKVFDAHFAGRPSSVVKLVVECVKANKFLDFLQEISNASK